MLQISKKAINYLQHNTSKPQGYRINKTKRLEMIIQLNSIQKKADVATLLLVTNRF